MNPSETVIKDAGGNLLPEQFYVLGALLGDGCAYKWRKDKYTRLILIGDEAFCKKYAKKLSLCVEKKINAFLNRSKNIWAVSFRNDETCKLFKRARKNPVYIRKFLNSGNTARNHREFVEGFFDAEGCVKLVKEKARKTAKVCLDITNTDFPLIEEIRVAIKNGLGIEARYSAQPAYLSPDGFPRKKSYHLRIYKKRSVKAFLEAISTTKLTEDKQPHVDRWLSVKNCHPLHPDNPLEPSTS